MNTDDRIKEVVDELFKEHGYSYPADTMELGQLYRMLIHNKKLTVQYNTSPVARICEHILQKLKPGTVKVTVKDDDDKRGFGPGGRWRNGVPVKITFEDAEEPSRPGVIIRTEIGKTIRGVAGNEGNVPRERWEQYVRDLAVL